MAGLIRSEDVQEVKERTSLEDVVREHVTLRQAGMGSLKGLCPFHDEKTPSFNIRPAVGAWHCFGCDEGGDVISFVTKIDHLTFTEAVERLAARIGMELRYEEGSGPREQEGGIGRRTRLLEAHRVAEEFYYAALVDSPEGRHARAFLRAKGFDGAAAKTFGVGYSPRTGDALAQHLRSKGFTDDEIVTGGLAGRGGRGLYDRFRGRVMWPIRDITGDTVGFGARRLFDDDRIQAKYLNTSETPIYKKTSVLYGLDLAKKKISQQRQAVIVEGYTDVMAAHLSGVETAVATCGTSFGADHITVLRRLLRDESGMAPARVIFTFDGDEAGRKAAMRAFSQDQRWAAQSYVAVAPSGQDPNDLRLAEGDAAVADLVEQAVPLFEFAVRTTIEPYDLEHAEQRIQALRAVAPIVASIRDGALRTEYVRTVAGWLGVDMEQVKTEVSRAARSQKAAAAEASERQTAGAAERQGPGAASPDSGSAQSGDAQESEAPGLPAPNLRDPTVQAERQLLQVALQYPSCLRGEDVIAISPDSLRAPVHQALWSGVRAAGAAMASNTATSMSWTEAVRQHTPQSAHRWISEIAVATVPVTLDPETGRPPTRYVESLVIRLLDAALGRRIDEALSAIQRSAGDETQVRRLSEQLTLLHRERAQLRARME